MIEEREEAAGADASPGRPSARTLLGVGALLFAAGGILWYAQTHSGESGRDAPTAPASSATTGGTDGPVTPPPDVNPLDDPDQPKVSELVRELTVGATEAPARLRQITSGLAGRVKTPAPYQPLGRDVLGPEEAAALLLANPAQVTLTSIEVGALLVAATMVVGVEAKAVVLNKEHAGRTSLRHRDIGISIEGLVGVLAPTRSPVPIESEAPPVAAEVAELHLDALRATSLAEQQKLDDAHALLTRVAAAAPEDQGFAFLLGQIAVLRGEVDTGLRQIVDAVDKAEDAEGRHQVAIALLREEELFLAYKSFTRAVELDPAHEEAWSALGALTLNRLQTVPEEQRQTLNQELNRIQTALEAIGPDALGLIELRVQRLRVAGETDKARALAIEALNVYPERATLHKLAAEIALGRGEVSIAERHFEKAAAADIYDPDAYLQLAQIRADRGDLAGAVEGLEKAAERAPHDPALLGQLAELYHGAGRVEDAMKAATQLKERFPTLVDGPLLLTQLTMAAGNAEGAAALAEEALKQHPRDDTLHTMLYFVYQALGRAEQAKSTLDRFLAFDPDARWKLAQQLIQNMQIEAGVSLLEEELAAKPDRMDVILALAQIYRLSGAAEHVERLRAQVAKTATNAEEALGLFDEAMLEIDELGRESAGTP